MRLIQVCNNARSKCSHFGSAHKENTFDNADSFLQWKNTEERDTQTSNNVVQNEGTTEYTNATDMVITGPRGVVGVLGTCKLGEPCTVYIKAITCVSSGKVSIEYCTNDNR